MVSSIFSDDLKDVFWKERKEESREFTAINLLTGNCKIWLGHVSSYIVLNVPDCVQVPLKQLMNYIFYHRKKFNLTTLTLYKNRLILAYFYLHQNLYSKHLRSYDEKQSF